jgi:M6 family metalloprotease-like protein
MKKISLLITLCYVCGLIHAAYMVNYPVELKQPDGTIVNCYVTGDEYYQRVHDADGYTLIRDPYTGYIVYAALQNDDLVPTKLIFSDGQKYDRERLTSLQKNSDISPLKKERLKADILKNTPPKSQESATAINQGILNNIVLFISFADDNSPFVSAAQYDEIFNSQTLSSMYKYFYEASYNTLQIFSTFHPAPSDNTVLSYQDPQPRSYYEVKSVVNPNGYSGNDERRIREHTLLKNAVAAIENDIPNDLNLDFNNDGRVDNICFIVKGATGAWNSLLWPHQWSLYSENVYIHNLRVWAYNFQLEEPLFNPNSNGKESILAHEMFHTLGAPDLYRYSNQNIDPVGSWDLMGHNTTPPQSSNAYMKYKYGGWIDHIPQITTSGTYIINDIWSPANNCYKIASPNSAEEYFMIEYRNKDIGWEQRVPGSGLLIYRINPLIHGNEDGPPDEIYLFRPHGTNVVNGTLNQAHFSTETGRTTFSDNTNPSAFLTNGTQGLSGIEIKNISTTGSVMTFEVIFPVAEMPVALPADNTGRTSFTAKWLPVTGATDYRLSVYYKDEGVPVYLMNDVAVGNVTQFDVTGIDNNQSTSWYYTLKSVSGEIPSEASNEITVELAIYDPISCEHITNVGEQDQIGYYTSGGNYLTGINQYAKEYAERFVLSDIANISGVKLNVRAADVDVTIKIWDDEDGLPGNILYSQDIQASDIVPDKKNDVRLLFTTATIVPATFFIGYEIKEATSQAQFAVNQTKPRESDPFNTSYLKHNDGTWRSFPGFYNGFYISLYISPEHCTFLPEPDFSSATATCTGAPVRFENTGIASAETTWLWDFGDGNTSTDKTPTHIYDHSGTFTVTLTAESHTGRNSTVMSDHITVSDLPDVDVTVTSASAGGYDDGIIELTITGSGTYHIRWTDDDEQLYVDQPVRNNLIPGTYSVEVTDMATTCITFIDHIIVGVQTGTSVKDVESDSYNYTIYPNPANSSITVTTGNLVNVRIYSSEGVLRLMRTIDKTSDINIEGLGSGSYIVTFTDERKTSNQKLVIK